MAKRKARLKYVLLGILGVLLVGAAVAVWQLDALLTRQVRAAAADVSAQLGRPVEVREVSTRLLPPLGVEVSSVSIGPAPGESAPLVSLDKVLVRVDALEALRSRGKTLHVLDAEVQGLTVNVVRSQDGSTNLERTLQKLSSDASEAPESPAQTREPFDLSGLRVDRFALLDARFALLDAQTTPPTQLEVSHVDFEVRDVVVGQPLALSLKAAVLTQEQNLELGVKTTPLSAELSALPTEVTLIAKALDLGKLGPFLGKDAGVRGGMLDARLESRLGSAVPGGKGPTELRANVTLSGLRFAASQGGKALDGKVEADLSGELSEGTLSLRKLDARFGPAHLEGRGEVSGLLTGAPAVKGLSLRLHPLDLDALAAHYPALHPQLGGTLGGVIAASLTGAGSGARQDLLLDVDLTGARLSVPKQLTKQAGAPMKLSAKLSGNAEKALAFSFDADLSGADLRPGGQLNKAPGQTLALSGRGSYAGGASTHVKLEAFEVKALDDTLAGSAAVELGAGGNPDALTLKLDGRAPRLNADALLLPSPEEKTPPAEAKAHTTQPAPGDPDRYDGMKGELALRIGTLVYDKMTLEDVLVVLKMVDDRVVLEKMSTRVFGGRVAADGTTLRLGPAKLPFDAKLRVQNLDVAQALQGRVPKTTLTGRLSGDIALKGAGFGKEDLARSLSGLMTGQLARGTYAGLDVVSGVSGHLSKALPLPSTALASNKLTSLGDVLPLGITFEDGVAKLKEPLNIDSRNSGLTLSGGVRLDGDLALDGSVALKPAAISALTRGKVKLDSDLPVGFKLTGPAWSPRLEQVDVKPAAKLIAEKAGRALLSNALGGKDVEAERLARQKADAAKAALTAKAAGERAKAEAAARAEAEKARKRAEDEAKKRLKGLFGR